MRRPLARSLALGASPLRQNPLALADFRYDASDAGSVTLAGSTVAQVNDLGRTASRHLSQGTASQQPAYGTYNARPAIIFDGVNDIMLNNTTTAATIGVANITFFLVAAFVSTSSKDMPLAIGVDNNALQVRTYLRETGQTTLGFSAWANDINAGPQISATGSFLFEVAQVGRQVFQTRNGINEAVYPRTLPSEPLPVNANGISLGSLQGTSVGSHYTNMAMHEAVGFYGFLGERERATIRAQLMAKWTLL